MIAAWLVTVALAAPADPDCPCRERRLELYGFAGVTPGRSYLGVVSLGGGARALLLPLAWTPTLGIEAAGIPTQVVRLYDDPYPAAGESVAASLGVRARGWSAGPWDVEVGVEAGAEVALVAVGLRSGTREGRTAILPELTVRLVARPPRSRLGVELAGGIHGEDGVLPRLQVGLDARFGG